MSRGSASVLRPRAFKGSRLRCLAAASLGPESLTAWLNALVAPHATIGADDPVAPRGFLQPNEARLGERRDFLSAAARHDLTRWWLNVPSRANTPNWDLVSGCHIDGRAGLVLVEAKAHHAELHEGGKPQGSERNERRIREAMSEANEALGGGVRGWRLSVESHYQLCNRFAWAWKVASLGVPVVLVYLGFLGASEMPKPLLTSEEWRASVLRHAQGIVPVDVWEHPVQAGAASFTPLIRSARVAASVVG